MSSQYSALQTKRAKDSCLQPTTRLFILSKFCFNHFQRKENTLIRNLTKITVECTFSINGLVLESFENSFMRNSCRRNGIQYPNFSQVANFDIPRVCDIDFMAIIDLRIYKGFDRENRSRCNFRPSVINDGQSPYKYSNLFSP